MDRARQLVAHYPRQFWLLFGGMLISASGGSMVWPFLTIYMRQRLDVSLTTVGLLLAINSGAQLVATFVAGPIVDRLGRKGVMVVSLLARALVYATMGWATSLAAWVPLMIANGGLAPLYRVGSDAMVADLLPPEERAGAYALLRMGNNVGIAIGPAVGGFLAVTSYGWTFAAATVSSLAFALITLFLVAETLPQAGGQHVELSPLATYHTLLHDRLFLIYCLVFTLAVVPASLLMVLLPVYAKEQYGVVESQYGFIMATNAAMVVLFQYPITSLTRRYPSLPVLAVGAFFYALGVGSVALGSSFWAFWLSMVVLTLGEMVLVPTGTTLTANLAPADQRGRYMGVYSLTWSLGIGLGPAIGGFLSDQIAPVAIWYGGLAFGLVAALAFLLLGRWLEEPAGEGA
jgi:MFS family permease